MKGFASTQLRQSARRLNAGFLSLCLILLNACSLPLTQTPQNLPATSVPPAGGGNCAYQWAQEDLPELSNEFQQAVQELQPEAKANAFAFGEDCVYTDGRAVFSAMETDFNVALQVSDLSNEADLGEWMVKVMQVIESIPPEKIQGPRPGRVSLDFQTGSEQKFVNFYIDQYQALPVGLSNAEIYQALQALNNIHHVIARMVFPKQSPLKKAVSSRRLAVT